MGTGEDQRGRDNDQDPHAREDADLRARLERLSNALETQSKETRQESGSEPSKGHMASAMSLGFRVLTEFVAAVLVGAFIGWQIDTWTGTKPAFLLVFLCLGTAAGFWNVYRIATGPQR